MDVSSPGKAAPPATSRPVIVSHRPMMPDPMVATSSPQTPTAPTLAGKGKTIQPLASAAKPAKDTEADTATTPSSATEAPKEDAAPAKKNITVNDTTDEPVKEEAPAPATEKPAEKTEKPTTDTPAEDDAAASAKQSPASPEKPAADDTHDTQKTDDKKSPEDDNLTGPPSKAMEEKRRAEAEAAAKAEREKYQKLIEEKTYFVPIDQSASSSGSKAATFLLFVLLFVLIGAVLAVDAGLLEIGIELPFDLIQN